MEYILAFLFSSNDILENIGIDLFYVFSGAILIYYVVFKREAVVNILKLMGIMAAYVFFVGILAVNFDMGLTVKFVVKMLFNVTLLVYIVRERYKWAVAKWCYSMCVLHGIETIVALFMRGSRLWKIEQYNWGTPERLKLFYDYPSILCFVSGLLLIFLIHQLLSKGLSLELCLATLVCLADMYYSFSFGGIVATAIALAVLVVAYFITNKNKLKRNVKWLIFFGVIVVGAMASFFISPVYMGRVRGVLQGSDNGLLFVVTGPVNWLVNALSKTNGRGVGIGFCKEIWGTAVMVIAESGVVGIVLLSGISITLIVLCIKYGRVIDGSMLIFVFMFQFSTGGFLSPMNWFIYGWIVADCYNNKDLMAEKKDKTLNDDEPVVCAIIGAKGLQNYGGYETFVDKLTEYHQENKNIKYLVACKANGQGAMDESKLQGVVPISDSEFMYHNAHCFKIKVPQIGPAQAIVYDLLAARYVINYFKKHQTEKPILYILTCRIGPFIKWIAGSMHEIGGVYYLNPDGHEFLRAVWSPKVRMYWKLSEKLMVKYADKVICDSKNIETYINASYEQYKPSTTYIAYGTDAKPSEIKDDDAIFTGWLKTYNIKINNYYLIVGRFVPENNYETMIREFMKSDTKKDLVIITNVNKKFLDELEEHLHYSCDLRIKFVGTVYNTQLLTKIRESAFAYLHGHEVGGTNPSLIEALGSTRVNLLFDVGFNRECGENGALYWKKDEGHLANLINECEKMSSEEITDLEAKAKKRIDDAYRWQFIADEYERVLLKTIG